MVNIDLSNGVPIVEQIVTKISNLIIAGAIGQNEKIMSVTELSKTITTSFNNVSQAYKQLVEMELIYNIGEDYYVGKQKDLIQKDFHQEQPIQKELIQKELIQKEIIQKSYSQNVTGVIKSENVDNVLKNLEDNIVVLLENDFTEEYLIEVINKQENLLKNFEKNTALLLQQGVQKEDLVDLVKTLKWRFYDWN